MKFRFILTALVLNIPLGFIPSAYARVLVELGIHTGGDEMTLVDDSNAVIESTKAGELYSLALGGTKAFTDNIEAQFTIGIKSNSNYALDSEASWVRYPVNGMIFYYSENYRLGLGATAHLYPKYKVSGTTKNASSSYKNALGGLLEFDYRLSGQLYLGLRYTAIEYVREDDGKRFDGSSIGLLLLLLI
jgi:hypothetical protein